MSGWANNMRRNLKPLQSRQPQRAQVAEEYRDAAFTRIEEHIAKLHETDPAAAADAEQQAKLLKLRNQANWWLDRRTWSAEMLLRRPL